MNLPLPLPGRGTFHTSFALMAFLAFTTVAVAQTDDFNDGNDNGWTHYSPLTPFGAGAVYSVPGGHYRITAPPSPAPADIGPQRAGSLRSGITYTRAQIATDILDWDDTINQSLGVIARVGTVGLGTTSGYTYNYNTKSGFHQITFVQGEQPVSQVDESMFRLDPTQRYRMVFTLVDNQLLGQTFSATNATVPLHSIFGTHDFYDSGTAGVFAFALDAAGPINASFDNYSASVPARVRATLLDATPAVGEQPAQPSTTVVVRLVNLETSLQPDSIHLEVDGKAVTFDLLDGAPIFVLTHTPAVPLATTAAHTAQVTFTDEDGVQTFAWSFGAAAVTQPATLVGSSTLDGLFQIDTSAVLNVSTKTFTVPITGAQRFFRVNDASARTITQVGSTGASLTIAFE